MNDLALNIRTDEYREILLTRGQFAIVDAVDYERIAAHKWVALWNPDTKTYYAVRSVYGDGEQFSVYMAREVLGLKRGDKTQAEHRNPSMTLDNRRSNLRISDQSQNNANRRMQSNNTSGFKGVSFHKNTGKWQAKIQFQGKDIYLGLFVTPKLAHAAYAVKATQLFGEFARVVDEIQWLTPKVAGLGPDGQGEFFE